MDVVLLYRSPTGGGDISVLYGRGNALSVTPEPITNQVDDKLFETSGVHMLSILVVVVFQFGVLIGFTSPPFRMLLIATKSERTILMKDCIFT